MWREAWFRWGVLLGVALGGFFDGILLHQILQWHHLLSLVPGANDIRSQILWDGYFHALMYLLAIVGLWRLWKTIPRDGKYGRQLVASLLSGFAIWHIVDALLSHWFLGIHRVRIDSGSPLLWDLLWLTLFGLVPLAIGIWLSQRQLPPPRHRQPHSTHVAILLVSLITTGAASWSLSPADASSGFTTVVFRPGLTPSQLFETLAATDSQLVWVDMSNKIAVLDTPPEQKLALYRHGALLASGTILPAGCFNWSRIEAA